MGEQYTQRKREKATTPFVVAHSQTLLSSLSLLESPIPDFFLLFFPPKKQILYTYTEYRWQVQTYHTYTSLHFISP